MCDLITQTVEIKTENIKLDSFLKFVGVVSTGGEAKEIISSGKVFVNDEQCFSRGKKLSTGDIVRVMGALYEVKSSENS